MVARRDREAAIVLPLSISNLQQGRHNFLSTSQIVTKIGGGVSHAKMALEPRPHAQENSEPWEIFGFVLVNLANLP